MKKILKKYQEEVKINYTKDTLSRHLIWNGEEVAILMYYLYKYKSLNKDKS